MTFGSKNEGRVGQEGRIVGWWRCHQATNNNLQQSVNVFVGVDASDDDGVDACSDGLYWMDGMECEVACCLLVFTHIQYNGTLQAIKSGVDLNLPREIHACGQHPSVRVCRC
jgi:hypothetical protein